MINSTPVTATPVPGSDTAPIGSIRNAVPCGALGFKIVPGGAKPGGYPFTIKSACGVVNIIESDAAFYFSTAEPYPGGDVFDATPGGTYTIHTTTRHGEVIGAAALRGRVQWSVFNDGVDTLTDSPPPVDSPGMFVPASSARNIQVYLGGSTPGPVGVWQRATSGTWYEAQALDAPGVFSLEVQAARPVYFVDKNNVGGITLEIDAEGEIG